MKCSECGEQFDEREWDYCPECECDVGDMTEADDYDYDYDGSRLEFADPGGVSALRAASPSNPRNLPCPTCGQPNRLTPKDRELGYQCDACAERAERGFDY